VDSFNRPGPVKGAAGLAHTSRGQKVTIYLREFFVSFCRSLHQFPLPSILRNIDYACHKRNWASGKVILFCGKPCHQLLAGSNVVEATESALKIF
jgi:hypothetical protein